MTYRIAQEVGHENTDELMPLYLTQYEEMRSRLASEGIEIPPCNPRLDQYFAASRAGYLLNFVVRLESGEAIGYSNIYVTNDMHSGELMAQEDSIYIRKDHRRGIGKKLTAFVLSHLASIGCKSMRIQAMTDPRAVKLWGRMGFKPAAVVMIKRF